MNKVEFEADLLQGDDRTQWEQTVANVLQRAYATYTGRNVIDELGLSSNKVKIVPYYVQNTNATTQARSFKDGYLLGHAMRDPQHGNLVAGNTPGTGAGSAVRLNYSPWRYPKDIQPVKLIHEMVHSAEVQRGVMFCNKASHCFDTVAEFDAILVENMARSELNLFIRRDHHGSFPLVGN